MLRTLLQVAALMTVAVPVGAQVLAPPSLPGQDRLAEELVQAIERKQVAAYTALLAPDVKVYEDGKLTASDRDQWMARFGQKLAAKGVSFRIGPAFSSTGRILTIEHFNSMASWGGSVSAHCCWSSDAVAYEIADGKVTVIRRLRGGDKTLIAADKRSPR